MNKTETKTGYTTPLEEFLSSTKKEQQELLSDLVIESNAIEGIYQYKTVTLNSEGEIPPFYEFSDHHKALDHVLDNYSIRDPTEEDIKHIHHTLTTNIFRETAEDLISRYDLSPEKQEQAIVAYQRNSGNYRQTKVWIGSKNGGYQGAPYFRQIPKLMKQLEKDIQNLTSPTEDIIWNLHHKFETIHPFIDGNGRTGRLLLNWLSLKYNNKFIVNESDKRGYYYDKIKLYKSKFKQENPSVHFYKDKLPLKI
jgi:Fic family protein